MNITLLKDRQGNSMKNTGEITTAFMRFTSLWRDMCEAFPNRPDEQTKALNLVAERHPGLYSLILNTISEDNNNYGFEIDRLYETIDILRNL